MFWIVSGTLCLSTSCLSTSEIACPMLLCALVIFCHCTLHLTTHCLFAVASVVVCALFLLKLHILVYLSQWLFACNIYNLHTYVIYYGHRPKFIKLSTLLNFLSLALGRLVESTYPCPVAQQNDDGFSFHLIPYFVTEIDFDQKLGVWLRYSIWYVYVNTRFRNIRG